MAVTYPRDSSGHFPLLPAASKVSEKEKEIKKYHFCT